MQNEIQPSDSTMEIASLIRKLQKQIGKRADLEVKLKRQDRKIHKRVRELALLAGRLPTRTLDIREVGKIEVEEIEEAGAGRDPGEEKGPGKDQEEGRRGPGGGPVKPHNEPPDERGGHAAAQ